MTSNTPSKKFRQKTVHFKGKEISEILARQIFVKYKLPVGSYDVRMHTTATPEEVNIKMRLKYNGEGKK